METKKLIKTNEQSEKDITFMKDANISQNNSIANSPSSTKHSESPGPINEKENDNIFINNDKNSLINELKTNNIKTENQNYNSSELKTITTEENLSTLDSEIKTNSFSKCEDNLNDKLTDNNIQNKQNITKEKIENNISTNDNKNENIKNNNDYKPVNIYCGTKKLTDEENIIRDAIISFGEYSFRVNGHECVTVNNELFFGKQKAGYFSNTDDEKDEKFIFEKQIYEIVENRLQKYYEYYKKHDYFNIDENYNEKENLKRFIKKVINFEEKNEKYCCVGFKAVVVSIVNLISQMIVIDYLKPILNKLRPYEELDLSVFNVLLDKYNKVKELCPFLRKDFELFIINFQKKKHLYFCMCELISESFWDCIFRIHIINFAFAVNYEKINTNYETEKTMQTIMSGLSEVHTAYKCILDRTLGIYNLMFYYDFVCEIIRFRQKSIKSKENENNNDNNSKDKKSENNNDNSSNNKENKENENNNDNNSNNKENKENENNNENNSNNKENNNIENYSLEEMYKYIQGDDNENKRKTAKKKKKKNKKNMEIMVKKDIDVDPIVEDFIKFLKYYNDKYQGYIKIKPVISKKWIDSLIEA